MRELEVLDHGAVSIFAFGRSNKHIYVVTIYHIACQYDNDQVVLLQVFAVFQMPPLILLGKSGFGGQKVPTEPELR
ncbi:hypothetical protein, partial [Desulfatiglans anilini]|uniref:hypothetical protein n=1 Tax=Desulfatiglans anilini TaxID=90728 RepID=UPI001ABF798B